MKVNFIILLIIIFFLFDLIICQDDNLTNSKQNIEVDFDQDGIIDIVEGFHTDTTFVVTFIISNDSSLFEFGLEDNMSQDAFCGKSIAMKLEALNYDPVEIFGEEIPGFKNSEKEIGINLSDDSFHFFWNYKLKIVQYWRL